MDMDEEKFSLERFLELMGERNESEDRAVGRDILRARAIGRKPKRKDETPEGADDASADERGKRAGLLGRVVERVRRAVGWKADEAVDLDRSRDWNSDPVEGETPSPTHFARESRAILPVKYSGLHSTDPFARMFHVEQSVETDVRERKTAGDAEQVVGRAEREWHEDEVPRARGRVWQEEEVESTKRARHWAEDVAEARERHDIRDSRSEANLREIAENDSNFAENRGKIAEFRKSDVSAGVDLRAISRAIERDARRY